MIRILITEGEGHSVRRLKKLLSQQPDVQIIGEAREADTAQNIIDGLKPDLLFLDVQLPGLTGPEAMENISYWPTVIFTTAYHPSIIKFFEQNSVDYLLKPFSRERFEKAIHRALQRSQRLNNKLLEVFQAASRKSNYLNRISVKAAADNMSISVEKIYYFQAKANHIFLHTYDSKFLCETPLRTLEDILDPEQFSRIHKNQIVSLQRVTKIRRSLRGKYKAVLNDEQKSTLKIARNYLPGLKKRLHT